MQYFSNYTFIYVLALIQTSQRESTILFITRIVAFVTFSLPHIQQSLPWKSATCLALPLSIGQQKLNWQDMKHSHSSDSHCQSTLLSVNYFL